MSFGYSIGDFLATIQLVNTIRKRFARAPAEFEDISSDVTQLSNVLQKIDDLEPDQELSDLEKKSLNEISQECGKILSKLQKDFLDKYHIIDDRNGNAGSKAKRVWKRIRWDQDEIRYFRERISTSLAAYNLFLTALNSTMTANIQQTTLRIDQRQINHEKQELLEWITAIDHTTYHNDFIKRRQERTGKWFLESSEFQDWMNGRSTTLFCPGIPGAGKTMITAIVIDHLERVVCPASPMNAIASVPPVGIAYIYCDFKRQDKQQQEDLLASLLRQLAQQQASIADKLKSVLDDYRQRRKRLSIDDLRSSLDTTAAEFSKIFVIIDALDECQISHDVQRDLLSEIFGLQSKYNLSVLATSRHIPEIISIFDGCSRVEVRATKEDIEEYLRGHMSQLPSFVSRNPQLQSEIVSKITQSVDGMFLLAQLHHESLKGKATKKAINSMLEKLPTGTEAYSHAYSDAMTRITSQLGDLKDLALNVLSWICCAMEPLTALELQHALAVEIGQLYLDEENIPDVDIMISVCAGLVTFDEESNIIRLVHYTTQQYFEQTWDSWFPNAHRSIALTCINYLSFTAFNAEPCSDEGFEKRLLQYPIYIYSAVYWGHHARKVEEAEYGDLIEDMTALTQFLKSYGNPSIAMEVLRWRKRWRKQWTLKEGRWERLTLRKGLGGTTYRKRMLNNSTPMHTAAYFGLAKSARRLMLYGLAADSRDIDECTPLHLAANNGDGAMVKLLIEFGANINAKNYWSGTALVYAISNGHTQVARCLLEAKADPDTRSSLDTPLYLAAKGNHEMIVRLLLDHGADPNSHNSYDETPLHYAAGQGHEMIVRLLLDHGADPNSLNCCFDTPLHSAARKGHDVIMALLLEGGAGVACKNVYNKSAIHLAATSGHETATSLLLKWGAVINPKRFNRDSSLSSAASHGNEKITTMPIREGADSNSRSMYGETTLLQVAEKGHVKVAVLLLEHSAEVDSRYESGKTPLSMSAFSGNLAMATLLLQHGAEVDSRDEDGRTPLSWAVQGVSVAVAALLLKNGADAYSKDKDGKTPLEWAEEPPYERIFRFLFKEGTNIDFYKSSKIPDAESEFTASDPRHADIRKLIKENYNTPNFQPADAQNLLFFAAAIGDLEIMEMLLPRCSSLEVIDDSGHTPLLLASSKIFDSSMGQESVIKWLLRNGANLESSDPSGRTPLSRAAATQKTNVVELLLDARACIDAQDNSGRTPLSHASAGYWHKNIELLLRNGAQPDSRDKNGRTPLSWAAARTAGTEHQCPPFGWEVKRTIELLVKADADLESKDEEGLTPLLHACKVAVPYFDAVECLLNVGANPNSRDKMVRMHFRYLWRLSPRTTSPATDFTSWGRQWLSF